MKRMRSLTHQVMYGKLMSMVIAPICGTTDDSLGSCMDDCYTISSDRLCDLLDYDL